MPRRAVAPLLLALALLAGCSEVRDTASRASDCVDLGRDVASAGLSRVPTQAEAEEAIRRLDERVGQLDNADVRDAATALRDRLREVLEAVRTGDTAAATRAADEARAAAREVAETCGIPLDQLLGLSRSQSR